jgi:O-antigen/teichoic acid export membrane protein
LPELRHTLLHTRCERLFKIGHDHPQFMISPSSHHNQVSGKLLARNSLVNLSGQLIPLVVLVITMPYVIHGLGVDRFGVLSLAQIILGYFSLFDFGLGRATTKFVAEALGKDQINHIPSIIYTSFLAQMILGFAGGLILYFLSHQAITFVFKIPPHLLEETRLMFTLLSIAIPVIICTLSIRGAIEASQRFDLINMVKVPSNVLLFSIPAIAVFFGLKLPGIMFLFILSWLMTLLAYFWICSMLYKSLIKEFFNIDKQLMKPLFLFGGWVLLSNILIPILNNSDRVIIGILISIEAVAYYSVSYEIISRLNIVPISISAALFPAFAIHIFQEKNNIKGLYLSTFKYLLIIIGTLTVSVIFISKVFLTLWLGERIAAETFLVMQILTFGFFFNALAQVPANLLDSVGRPDLKAKTLFLYMPFFLLLLWILVLKFGIVGAAVAWTIRAAAELLFFSFIFTKTISIKYNAYRKNKIFQGLFAYILSCILITLSQLWFDHFIISSIVYSFWIIINTLFVWYYLLNDEERQLAVTSVSKWRHGNALRNLQ